MKKTALFLLLSLLSCILQAQVTDSPISKASPSLETLHGNWFDRKHGGWIAGIYDSVAIVDNSICDVRQVRMEGNSVELMLQDKENGTTQTVTLTPQRNGTCLMKQGNGKRKLTHSPQQPTVTPDNGYGNFFNPDTATIQGYIAGYNARMGFETGLIYLKDIITGTDVPMAVPIAPDGTFACKLPMKHPAVLAILLNDRWLFFFAEPGKTQTMYVNAEDIMAQRSSDREIPLLFMGEDARLSCLANELSKRWSYPYAKLNDARLKLTPAQFRESLRPMVAQWQHVGDSLASVYGASQKAVSLIRHTMSLNEADVSFSFLSPRSYLSEQYPDNEALKAKVEDDYYDFLRRMPLDDPEMLACYDADSFTGNFQFIRPIWNITRRGFSWSSSMTKEEKDEKHLAHEAVKQSRMDSVVACISGKERPFLWQMIGVQDVKSNLAYFDTYDGKRKYADMVKEMVKDYPFLAGQVEQVYAARMAEERSRSYTLPEGKATDIFRNIIKEHAGKVLFVDFWATTCGPCRAGIEATADLRQKYKDHPDFKFIYITAANESPRADYDRYVEKNIKGEASYYVSSTEFAYLRQLFKFDGIPHYEVVEKDGTICIDNIGTWNLRNFLQERFPMKDN